MKNTTALGLICLCFVGCVSSGTSPLRMNEPYTLAVDYSRNIEDSVRAGSYGWSSKDITSANFQSTESGLRQITVQLFEFPRYTPIERTIELQRQKQRRPATIKELLALAERYPEIQLHRTVFALGSTCSIVVEDKPGFAGSANQMQPGVHATSPSRMVAQTYWPYLSSEGSLRILTLGKVSLMMQDPFQELWGCFVLIE